MEETKNGPKEWESTGQRRELCRTSVLALESEVLRCPRTGAEHEFITFRLPDWVNVIAVTPEKRIVAIRQFRCGSRSVEWEIPGGCVDPSDPDPVAAGVRELAEETGFRGKNARVIGSVNPNPAFQNNHSWTVLVEEAVRTGDPAMEVTEDIETVLLEPSRFLELIRSGEMRYALVMNAFLFYLLERNSVKLEEGVTTE